MTANRLLYYSTGNFNEIVSNAGRVGGLNGNHISLMTQIEADICKILDSNIVEEIEEQFQAFKQCKDYWEIQDNDVYNSD